MSSTPPSNRPPRRLIRSPRRGDDPAAKNDDHDLQSTTNSSRGYPTTRPPSRNGTIIGTTEPARPAPSIPIAKEPRNPWGEELRKKIEPCARLKLTPLRDMIRAPFVMVPNPGATSSARPWTSGARRSSARRTRSGRSGRSTPKKSGPTELDPPARDLRNPSPLEPRLRIFLHPFLPSSTSLKDASHNIARTTDFDKKWTVGSGSTSSPRSYRLRPPNPLAAGRIPQYRPHC